MSNVTYYIGAGASAEGLSINKELKDTTTLYNSLATLASELVFKPLGTEHYVDDPNIKKIASDLSWLSNEARKFNTVDTYAKYLYVKKEYDKLFRLKKTLSFYFIYEQLIAKKLDKRALVFLTTIMEKGPKFPDNIKIISWNYDFQIQLAAHEFKQEFRSGDNKHKSLIQYYPPLYHGPAGNETHKYSMVQLNGVAGHIDKDLLILNPIIQNEETNVHSILKWLDTQRRNNDILTFAWENDKNDSYDIIGNIHHKDAMKIAESIAKETEILVIIGYSFPFFNREFDNKLIQTMKNNTPHFKKIYFQDKYMNSEFLDKQFDITRSVPVKIEHIERCDNYFIPPEL